MVFFLSFSLASDWRKIPCLFTSSYPVFYLQPCAVILSRGLFGAVSVNTRPEIETYIAEDVYVNP